MGMRRAGCVETRTSGSEGGPGKRIELKSRHRALVRPYERAVVLCMDEKSSVQALDRTQPSLPMKKGRAGTMTHDYKRHGTTALLAALNALPGWSSASAWLTTVTRSS